MHTARQVAAALAENPERALEMALEVWLECRHPVVADVVEWIDGQLPREVPAASDSGFQDHWLDKADVGASTADIGWLAHTLTHKLWLESGHWQRSPRAQRLRHAPLVARLDALAAVGPDPRVASALAAVIVGDGIAAADVVPYELCLDVLIRAGDPRQLSKLEACRRDPVSRYKAIRGFQRTGLARAFPPLEQVLVTPLVDADDWEALLPASHLAPDDLKKRAVELLEAIYNNPDDLELRLVYADALLELGDPRGEFISLQLADDLSAADKRRMYELESQHADEWLGPDLRRVFRNAQFTGGFLEYAWLRADSDASAAVWKRAYVDPRLATLHKLFNVNSGNKRHYEAFLNSPAAKSLED